MHHDGIIDLLESRGFDRSQRFRLVRHAPGVSDIHRRGLFEIYQAIQVLPKFHDIDSIVSFLALPNTRARFEGVFNVLGFVSAEEARKDPKIPREPWTRGEYFYILERAPDFRDLEGRVIIDWGPGARAWVQRPTYKRVLQRDAPSMS